MLTYAVCYARSEPLLARYIPISLMTYSTDITRYSNNILIFIYLNFVFQYHFFKFIFSNILFY